MLEITRLASLSAGLVLLLCSGLSFSQAQANLVLNPDFDTDVSNWSEVGVHDSSVDYDGMAPTSGALKIENTSSLAYTSVLKRQCITEIVAGGTYSLSSYVLVDSSQPNTAEVFAYIGWVDDLACTSFLYINDMTSSAAQTGSWEVIEATDFTAPVEAKAGVVFLVVKKSEADGSFIAHFDHVEFVPEPSAAILTAASLLTLIILSNILRK